MVRILIVDDHPIAAGGIERLIEHDENIQVTVSLSALEALEIVRTEQFNLMLFDMKMKEIDGLGLCRQVLQIKPESCILILSGHDLEPYMNLILDSGAAGWMSKETNYKEMINIIYNAINGYSVISTRMLRQMRRTITRSTATDDRTDIGLMLNEREQTILLAASCGKLNKEIADDLHLSQRTVEKDLTAIYKKLGVNNKTEAIMYAKRYGMLNKEEVY